MAGLLNPMPNHQVSQPFGGDYYMESPGYLKYDKGVPWQAKRIPFAGAVERHDLHTGVDIVCPVGTRILAPDNMRIRINAIDSTDNHYLVAGLRTGTVVVFYHLSKVLLPVGSVVKRGTEFALSGATGKLVSGPHLHWEVRHAFAADPDYHNWINWFAFNPQRLQVGGDKADTPWIVSTH